METERSRGGTVDEVRARIADRRRRRRARWRRSVLTGALVAAVALPLVWREVRTWPHLPVRGAMFHPFGRPVDYQDCGFHTGQDWFAPEGSSVYAVADGVVVHVGPLWVRGDGVGRGDFAVVLDHGDYLTTYSHNRAARVQAGDAVRRGQVIAELGREGFSRGPHLHLEKVVGPYTGDWRRPFAGCDDYLDPGTRWAPF